MEEIHHCIMLASDPLVVMTTGELDMNNPRLIFGLEMGSRINDRCWHDIRTRMRQ